MSSIQQTQEKWKGKAKTELLGCKAEQEYPENPVASDFVAVSRLQLMNMVLEKDDGCVIEWLYEVEPVKGWKLEYLDLFIGSGLDEMGQRIQGALKTMEEALVGV
ncbi:hypothetical protein P8452_14947 [Trifolium repens]|nr:hypothetical protein P8452_14947 [Trifolium repens]